MFRINQRAVVLIAMVAIGAVGALMATGRGRLGGRQQSDVALPSLSDRVVVAELFTSEGCSSCPPADALLRRLAHDQFGPGVRVLALEEHVDYWDRLGWRDPFSSPGFSNRQSAYEAKVFRSGNVYTPQLVIDGRLQEIGSNENAVRRAIALAARDEKAVVSISAGRGDAGHLRVQVQVLTPPGVIVREKADVIVAVAEDQLTSNVERGENSGRLLKHGAVVRSVTALGSLTVLHTFSAVTSIPTASSWTTRNLTVIAFVQERQSRRILGAGSANVDLLPNGS